MHISSVEPSPQVTKWAGAFRSAGSSWANVGLYVHVTCTRSPAVTRMGEARL